MRFNFGSPLLEYAQKKYSSVGEDGIIEHIFKVCNISDGIVVEFGAWDGVYSSNTHNLWKDGKYKAILIEDDQKKYRELKSNFGNRVETINAKVSININDVTSLNNLLLNCKTEITNDNFQLLSIDVDGDDYEIWESFDIFKPKLVIIETNSGNIESAIEGCSLKEVNELARKKGYTLICTTGNAFCIRDDLAHLFNIVSLEQIYITPEQIDILWKD